MVRIGFRDMGIQDEKKQKTILDFHPGSSVVFEGRVWIGGGTRIQTKGQLIFGDDFYLSLNSQIIAHDKIRFESDCTVGWNVLIMDTDFHSTIDFGTNEPYPMTKPILIRRHCWICNGAQLLKGTELPEDCIVGAMSFCNKRYDIPAHSLIAGIPATLKRLNISHVR